MHGACPLATTRDARAPCPLRRAGLLLLLPATSLSTQRPTPPRAPLDIAVEDAADVWSRADGTGYANDTAMKRSTCASSPMAASMPR